MLAWFAFGLLCQRCLLARRSIEARLLRVTQPIEASEVCWGIGDLPHVAETLRTARAPAPENASPGDPNADDGVVGTKEFLKMARKVRSHCGGPYQGEQGIAFIQRHGYLYFLLINHLP